MIKSTTLDNGVRLITERVEHMHTVSIGIWVANGSRHETSEVNGVAHFIEHLLFKGTKKRSARQISLEMDSMGGILNAFTGHEYVCYYAKVLAGFLPRATELLCDIFLESTFPADELERERNVILQEIKMRDDSPDEFIHDQFHKNFWGGSSLGRSILGSEETIRGLSRDQIIEYMRKRYIPEEIIISAAGNVRHEELLDLVTVAFSSIPSADGATPLETAIPFAGARINSNNRDMEQMLLCLGTRGLPHGDPARYQLYILSTILGGGMSSRLFQEIREKRGLAYSVYSYVNSHADCGALVIHAGTDREKCVETVNIVLDELRRLKVEPIQDDELDSAREQLKGKLLMSLESSESLMTRLAKNDMYLGRNQPIAEMIKAFDAVKPAEMMNLANRLFDGSSLLLELAGKTDGLEIDIEQLKL